MAPALDALAADPWRLLEVAVDGPLHPGGREATAALLDRAGVDGETRLLDVGCGAGGALALARERGAGAVGLDRRPGAAGALRGDISALPVADGGVDVVLGECVLCLADDFGEVVDEIARVLPPGGRLALSDVTATGEPPSLPAPLDRVLCLDGTRQPERLREQVADAGFDVAEVRTHREDLLSMRDRLLDAVDLDRLARLLDAGERIRDGVADLSAAVQAGEVGYVSLVATRRTGDSG